MGSDKTKQLSEQTHGYLKKLEAGHLDIKELEGLRAVLRFHEYRYYILNDPLVSDFEYDRLYKALEKLEGENPDSVTPDSPTQRVGKSLTKEFPTVQHLVPMLSLQNSYDNDDLIDFDRKARELTGMEQLEYCVEPKFDGASISLIYEGDKLVRGATRGNGVQGDDITPNIRQIRTIPLTAAFSEWGLQTVEIRGEVLINKKNVQSLQRCVDGTRPAAAGQPPQCCVGHTAHQRPAGSKPPQARGLYVPYFLLYYHGPYSGSG